jgi:saccharopine dehydrogenase-like NADP-dependent oxidoreductase
MNAVDPQFVMSIFDGALEAGTNYMDMACSLSAPHPTDPYRTPGLKLGDEQFARHDDWVRDGRLAVLGMGMDPGLADLFARYAADQLFDEVHEVHVRDGGDLAIPGYAFAPVFSIWTTIEECLNPPIEWNGEQRLDHDRAVQRARVFPFPEGVG